MDLSQIKIRKIYIQLLNEGSVMYRPAYGIEISPNEYVLLNINHDIEDEDWEFLPGSIVFCENHSFSNGINGMRANSMSVIKPVDLEHL